MDLSGAVLNGPAEGALHDGASVDACERLDFLVGRNKSAWNKVRFERRDAGGGPGVVLEEETLSLMRPNSAEETLLGWFERGGETRPWLQHPGGGPGYAAAVRVYPDEGLAIAVLASGTAAPASMIADLVAGLEN